jgi:hypothetical protein
MLRNAEAGESLDFMPEATSQLENQPIQNNSAVMTIKTLIRGFIMLNTKDSVSSDSLWCWSRKVSE